MHIHAGLQICTVSARSARARPAGVHPGPRPWADFAGFRDLHTRYITIHCDIIRRVPLMHIYIYIYIYIYVYIVALIAQWLERELRRRRSWVQSSPHQTERVRGQSTQSLWRITCPPPEQTPRTCREDPLGQKKKIYIYVYIYIYIYTYIYIYIHLSLSIYIYIYIFLSFSSDMLDHLIFAACMFHALICPVPLHP